jgi:hypothetical protein
MVNPRWRVRWMGVLAIYLRGAKSLQYVLIKELNSLYWTYSINASFSSTRAVNT